MNFKHDMLCKVQVSTSSFFFYFRVLHIFCIWKNIINLSVSSWWMWLERGTWFWISNLTRYLKFKAPHLPSYDLRVLQMFCIWQNIINLSLLSWGMCLEMGNSMIDKDFEFFTWHAMWSTRLHTFLLLTSGSSRCLVFQRIFSNYHYHDDECD